MLVRAPQQLSLSLSSTKRAAAFARQLKWSRLHATGSMQWAQGHIMHAAGAATEVNADVPRVRAVSIKVL